MHGVQRTWEVGNTERCPGWCIVCFPPCVLPLHGVRKSCGGQIAQPLRSDWNSSKDPLCAACRSLTAKLLWGTRLLILAAVVIWGLYFPSEALLAVSGRKFLEAEEPGCVTPTQSGGTAPAPISPANLLGKPASRFVSCEPAFSDQAHSIRHLAQDFICSAFLGGQRETGTG